MFKIYKGGEYFFQWDLGQRLEMTEDFTSVHFCNQTEGCALVCDTYIEDGIRLVNVPNVLLQNTNNIRVYGCYAEGDNVCFAKDYQIFRVIKRGKPEEYVYTEEDVFTYEALEARVEALENGAGLTGESGVPFVVDGELSVKEETTDSNTVYDVYISVNIDTYTKYTIGDSFMIKLNNSLTDCFEAGETIITKSFRNTYITINDLESKLINGGSYLENKFDIIALFNYWSDLIVIYRYGQGETAGFYLWGHEQTSNCECAELMQEYANTSLSNVDNEVFKEKAIEAGIYTEDDAGLAGETETALADLSNVDNEVFKAKSDSSGVCKELAEKVTSLEEQIAGLTNGEEVSY